jgi:hypothetical protein
VVVMYIKKQTGEVVHRGFVPVDPWQQIGADCGTTGPTKWYNVNPEVIEGIRRGSIKRLRLCKKCFKE